MNILIIVPKDKGHEGYAQMAAYAELWEQSGLELTHRMHNWIRASNDDRVTVVLYPRKSSADTCGQTADVLMVHLDLVCHRDWRELECAMLACLISSRGFTKVFRCGEYKVYAKEGV